MTPQDEHDPNNPAHALYCNPCYNKMPGIGVRPHTAEIRFFDEDENGESTRTQDMLAAEASGFDFPPNVEPVFDPSILASILDFGGGTPATRHRAEFLEYYGREDEAFERDEE